MSGVFSFWGNRKQTMNDVIRLPEVFPFGLCRRDFIIFKLISIYENLLTQCYNRSRGFPEDMAKTLWNNYEALDPLNTQRSYPSFVCCYGGTTDNGDFV